VVTSAYIFNLEELERKYKLVLWDPNAIEEKVDTSPVDMSKLPKDNVQEELPWQ
jgi:hypothetical protein